MGRPHMFAVAALAVAFTGAGLQAQTSSTGGPATDARAVALWIALQIPTAHEAVATDPLLAELSGWERDRWGNLVLEVGSGAPHRVVACGLDEHGYAVSRITPEGYLRLHSVGRGSGHDLWDQSHEGQQVEVLTARGAVPGVVAIANGHFAAQHRGENAVVTADDLWVDVGARSADEVRAMGITLLDPLLRRLPPWSFAGHAAGPGAGARAGCAAVAAVGDAARVTGLTSGRTTFLLSAQRVMGWVGLGSALVRMEAGDALTVLDGGLEPGRAAPQGARRGAGALGGVEPVLRHAGLDSVTWVAPGVLHPGTLVESISGASVRDLVGVVAEAAGVPSAAGAEIPAPQMAADAAAGEHGGEREAHGAGAHTGGNAAAGTRPSIGQVAALLDSLVEIHAVSGHEAPMRAAVLARMPDWARARAEVDAAGNVVVAFGPARDTVVFVAHLDEVGWEVRRVAPDGTVDLARRGGAIPSAWEGQPAELRPVGAAAPIRGIFVPREGTDEKRPAEVRAWFGLDSAALAARGVGPGAAVTAWKEGLRLGPTRFTGRGLDDRAGTTALLLALNRMDPERVPRTVVFAWSVEEEIGLNGAEALAERFGPTVQRVYSVDTFVSSDTPLESPHFAYAPLGDGPVLRAVENSSISPPAERRRVQGVAADHGLDLQIGLTQGGTDGTAFTFWGAPNAGLSWPGRYSHSPAEVLDLEDLSTLVMLIAAVATAR